MLWLLRCCCSKQYHWASLVLVQVSGSTLAVQGLLHVYKLGDFPSTLIWSVNLISLAVAGEPVPVPLTAYFSRWYQWAHTWQYATMHGLVHMVAKLWHYSYKAWFGGNCMLIFYAGSTSAVQAAMSVLFTTAMLVVALLCWRATTSNCLQYNKYFIHDFCRLPRGTIQVCWDRVWRNKPCIQAMSTCIHVYVVIAVMTLVWYI